MQYPYYPVEYPYHMLTHTSMCVPHQKYVLYIRILSLRGFQKVPTRCKWALFDRSLCFWSVPFSWPRAPRPPYIFRNMEKRAFWTCMGHEGVGALQKMVSGRQRGRVRDFGLVFRKPGLGQARVRVIFSGVHPRTFSKPWNWGEPRPEMDSARS